MILTQRMEYLSLSEELCAPIIPLLSLYMYALTSIGISHDAWSSLLFCSRM